VAPSALSAALPAHGGRGRGPAARFARLVPGASLRPRSAIAAKAHFDNDSQRDQVLGLYDEGIAKLKESSD
jgi:hypothetical protein